MSAVSLLSSSIEEALRHNPIPALRVLDVEETDAQVVISGEVSSYYLKQMAQESVLSLVSGRRLLNHVRVVRGR